MQIRRLAPDDWETYRAVRMRALQDAPDAFARTYAEEAEHDEEQWRGRIARNAVFLAGDSGVAVGIDRGDGKAGLVSVWVAPESRCHGIGTALVERVLEWAEDGDLAEVTLWVNEANAEALGLYERAGFAATGARKGLRDGIQELELAIALPR